ncbi:MAG: hypothetical protein H6623_07035 [Bdellovibrionaceae bacterium]|nr:hypothetical protein [Pseudobdellovibrionaceae bacterium]
MPTLETKVEKPNLPEWQCQITTPPKNPSGYTVGEIFTLSCNGNALAGTTESKQNSEGVTLTLKPPVKIKLAENFDYAVVLLKPLELGENKLTYEATAYRAMKSQFPFLEFVDSSGQGFISQPMELNVASILDTQNPPKAPYGPIGAMPMPWPMWIFFMGFIMAMVLMGWLAIFLRHRIQKRNLEKNIRKFQSPMGSYHQFQKDLRLLKRGVLFSSRSDWQPGQVQNYIAALNEHVRMFLLREFIVPATTWSTRQTLGEIRQKAKNDYHRFRLPLRQALAELDRAQSSYEKMSSQDCEQLTHIASQAVDSVWKYKNRGVAR